MSETNITHKELNSLIKIYYERKVPLFIWGSMGIGKSSIVKDVSKQLAKELKCEFLDGEHNGKDKFGFIDVRISQLEPSDLRGLPTIDNTNEIKLTKWVSPSWLPSDSESKGILFFDELNLAPPSIQASAYQLILDRRLGDYVLPKGWVIISAGNTSDDKANVFELPSPLANRFSHLKLNTPSKEDWVAWGLANGVDNRIISFIEFKPSYLFKFDRNNKDKAFPTPRSWEYVSKLIKDNKLSDDVTQNLISSAVGCGVGVEFMSFLKLSKKIDINNLINNPKQVEQIKEIDLKYCLLSAIVDKYQEDKKKLEKILGICEYLEPEFAILLLSFLKNARTDFVKDVVKLNSWNKLAVKYGRYLLD